MEKFIRYREDGNVYRLYFTNSSMTLSKRKCGTTILNIIEKCKRDNRKYRNDFKIKGDVVEVYFWDNKTEDVTTILLDKDVWLKYNEHYIHMQMGYPSITYNGERWRLHRLIMGLPLRVDNNKNKNIVDHINGDPLDNRKENLRVVSDKINKKNIGFFNPNNSQSGVHGVSRTSNGKGWRVRFGREDSSKNFDKLSEAIKYRYEEGERKGYYFREGSTTIENHINRLIESGK